MDDKFYEKVDGMFEENLEYEEIPVIRIKDLVNNKILEGEQYETRLRFDVNLKMYKLQDNGDWVLVNNPNFKPVVVYKENFIKKAAF